MALETVSQTTSVELDGASPAAKARFGESVQEYATRLAAKVQGLEKEQRQAGVADAEITAGTVVDESLRARPERISKMDIFLRIGAPTSALFAGIFGSYLNSIWQAITFGIFLGVALLTSILSVVRTRG